MWRSEKCRSHRSRHRGTCTHDAPNFRSRPADPRSNHVDHFDLARLRAGDVPGVALSGTPPVWRDADNYEIEYCFQVPGGNQRQQSG